MKALIVVDVQRDFCLGGTLAVNDADKIVEPINALMEKYNKNGDIVVASKDWHPEKTVHFDKWPVHCVAGEPGADFHPKLNELLIHKTFLKGMDNSDTGYSAFEATSDDLDTYLRTNKVTEVYVVGLCLDYCVFSTALDAVKLGYKTNVNPDLTAFVTKETGQKAVLDMIDAGVSVDGGIPVTIVGKVD